MGTHHVFFTHHLQDQTVSTISSILTRYTETKTPIRMTAKHNPGGQRIPVKFTSNT